jgi:hypothetical protein
MHKRAIAASMAAPLALLLAALPASADTEYTGTATPMDWRLAVILSVLGIVVFHVALERINRGR